MPTHAEVIEAVIAEREEARLLLDQCFEQLTLLAQAAGAPNVLGEEEAWLAEVEPEEVARFNEVCRQVERKLKEWGLAEWQ